MNIYWRFLNYTTRKGKVKVLINGSFNFKTMYSDDENNLREELPICTLWIMQINTDTDLPPVLMQTAIQSKGGCGWNNNYGGRGSL